MTQVRQFPEVPELVSRTYIGLRYAFDCIHANWNELRGTLSHGYPNCHTIARAIARRFEHLRVVDGFIPFICKPSKEYDGPKQMLVTELGGKISMSPVVSDHKEHSWLEFCEHPGFIIDTAPIGALPVVSSPILIFRDQWAFPYIEEVLPGSSLENIREEDVRGFADLLRRAVLHQRELT